MSRPTARNETEAGTRARKLYAWAVSSVVVAFLPVALLGLLLPVNEYRATGIENAADCDGPLGVMLLVGPSFLVYAAGVVFYATRLKGRRRAVWAALLVLCALLTAAAGAKSWAAYAEKSRPEHLEVCGEGW